MESTAGAIPLPTLPGPPSTPRIRRGRKAPWGPATGHHPATGARAALLGMRRPRTAAGRGGVTGEPRRRVRVALSVRRARSAADRVPPRGGPDRVAYDAGPLRGVCKAFKLQVPLLSFQEG